MAGAYYNEIDPDAVAVLRALISDGVLAPGDVDDRSIKDVSPDDLLGYTQCHFFAGGGLWSVAARLAGWPDDRPLWTGSCPCQGESVAGKRLGADDPRHLWPDFHRLIRASRPTIVMGEQVARAAGTHWLDRVCSDLEDEDYAIRAVDIPACAVDAPHERNRLYWIAVADAQRAERRQAEARRACSHRQEDERNEGPDWLGGRDAHRVLADAHTCGRDGRQADEVWGSEQRAPYERADVGGRGRNGSWWAGAEWVECHDGKARRTQPGSSLLVDGVPGRVGLWSLAGNGISPILAAEVIGAFLDAEGHPRPGQD